MDVQFILNVLYVCFGTFAFLLLFHVPAYLFLRKPHQVLHYLARFNHKMWIQSGRQGEFAFQVELDPERTSEYRGVETLFVVGVVSLISALILDWMILSLIWEFLNCA